VIKILQGSAVTQTVFGALNISLSCKFPIIKLSKLVGSGQKYCNSKH